MKLNLYTKIFGKAVYLKDKVNKKINLDFYYLIKIECSNCFRVEEIYVKKGVYLTDAKRLIKCTNCGCKIK
jgi:hypothetical protein